MTDATSGQTSSQFWTKFSSHPASVGESYFEHMGFALQFSWFLITAAAAALVHAFIPPLCETTASRRVMMLHGLLTRRAKARNS